MYFKEIVELVEALKIKHIISVNPSDLIPKLNHCSRYKIMSIKTILRLSKII